MKNAEIINYKCKTKINISENIVPPSQVVDSVELVVEGDNLIEMKRLPGENDVIN